MDDHTAYVRQYTKLSPEFDVVERTGAEAAVSPGAFTILGGIYNADEGGGIPSTNNKAFLGRGEGMFKLADRVSLGWVGTSSARKPASRVSVRRTTGGSARSASRISPSSGRRTGSGPPPAVRRRRHWRHMQRRIMFSPRALTSSLRTTSMTRISTLRPARNPGTASGWSSSL